MTNVRRNTQRGRFMYGDVKASSSTKVVRNTKTGKLVTVKGAGALKDAPLRFKRGVDLTKPISSQALRASKKK